MAEVRAETRQQEREEVYAALQYAASFNCLVEEPKEKDFRGSEKRDIERNGARKPTSIGA